MQNNNKNTSIANELESIAEQIASLDKNDIQAALAGINKAHEEIENLAQENEIPTLRAIVHWITLSTEFDELNEKQLSTLLVQNSYSNWIEVLAKILRNNELSQLPMLHQSLTSPDWIVRPSPPLLKETAIWISEISDDNELTKNAESIVDDEQTSSDSIDALIDEQIDKAIQANEELLIQTNAFEEIKSSNIGENNLSEEEINEHTDDKENESNPLIQVEEVNHSHRVYDDADTNELDSEVNIKTKSFTENDQLLETIIAESDSSNMDTNISDQTDFDIELNDIILKLQSIHININDIFSSKDSYHKQLDRLRLLSTTSEYEEITPIVEWCQKNLQLFEQNPTDEISAFMQSGSAWSWIEQLNYCINNNSKERCIINLSAELTKKEWLEPIDTDVLQALLHWVKSNNKIEDTEPETTSSSSSSSITSAPELIDNNIFDEAIINEVKVHEELIEENKNLTPSEVSGLQINWDDDTHPELLMVYLEETPVQIAELVDLLVKVSNKSADKEEKTLASRLAHTIKGGSSIVGITALSEFNYRLETLLDYSITHELSQELLDLLPKAANSLDSLFEAVQLQLDEPIEFYPVYKQLDVLVNNLEINEENEDEEILSTPELPDFIINQNIESEASIRDTKAEEIEVIADELGTIDVTEKSITNSTIEEKEVIKEPNITKTIEESNDSEDTEKSPFILNWDDDIHPELLMVYLEETPDQITQLVPLMSKISEGNAEKDEKHTASRMAHTIKGSSALVGITALSEFSYRLESLLDHSVKQDLSKEILAILPEAASCLENLFSAVQLQEDEPAEYYPLFLKLDEFVNNLEEVDEVLELSTPVLPDFIKNQNKAKIEDKSIVAELHEEIEDKVEDTLTPSAIVEEETLVVEGTDSVVEVKEELNTEEKVSLEKLQSHEDLQNITDEIDDIVMNLVSIASNNKVIAANLDEYSIELQRFDLIADISGYPELSLLSQWCQKNLVLLAQNNSDKNKSFINSAEIWSWIEYVGASLNDLDDMSHLSALSAELMRDEWPQAIEMKDLQTVLLALRNLDKNNPEDQNNSEESADVAKRNIAENSNKNEIISWDQDVHPELLAVYFNETPEQIDKVAKLLNKIAKKQSNSEDHKNAARIAHTIKGASGVVGLNSLVDLTHNLEDILDYTVNNEIPDETMELLAESSDCLESLFENIQNKQAEPEEFSSVLDRLISFSNSIGRERITPDYMLGSQDLEEITEKVTTPDIESKPLTPIENNASKAIVNEAHIRVPVSVIDKLLNLAGELVTTSSQVGDRLTKALMTNKAIKSQDQRVHKILDELSQTIHLQEKEQKNMFSSLENSDFDSLEMDSYNELHSVASLLSETFIDGQELDNNLTSQLNDLNDKLSSLDKLNKDFSNVVLSSRMVSIDTIVPRLERIVRQTCRKTGKKAELLVTGNNINIDTDILNGLMDPLLHMLRNSIDHGIESPDKRLKKHKSETGIIELSFVRDGNNILMSLQDDGAGIDPDMVYQKAVHKDIITPEQEFSKDEILKLILTPGFSTQDKVSDISGRGVGMDVVNSSVEDLNGSLSIESELGHGTSINLAIPLTLITNTTLMVKSADNIVAVPTDTIEQILYQEANSVITRDNTYFVEYEDTELEIKQLSQLLGWSNVKVDFSQSFSLLVIKSGTESYAIHIDSIISSREVVVKPLSPWISPTKGIIGACHLNDGGVAPVINLVSVLTKFSQSKNTAQAIIEDIQVVTTPQILVVDDSLSNRKALSLIIDKTEYDVLTAVDGMDALQIMNENKVDLIFTDLEMPRMNGLELTQAVRSWTDKSNTPIVMITSRTTNKHRELAEKAGVNDYLTKPVVTETLLESINKWLEQTESAEI